MFVTLHKNSKKKIFRVNRLVALTFIPNPNNLPEVDHADGRPFNNHVTNLRWVTSSDNQKFALATGLRKMGAEHGQAKLTDEQVTYIRNNPDNLTQRLLAKKFDVVKTTIADIQRGKKYKTSAGIVRDKIDNRVPDTIREKIRAEYVYGSVEFGIRGLAKLYGISHDTVFKIIHEK